MLGWQSGFDALTGDGTILCRILGVKTWLSTLGMVYVSFGWDTKSCWSLLSRSWCLPGPGEVKDPKQWVNQMCNLSWTTPVLAQKWAVWCIVPFFFFFVMLAVTEPYIISSYHARDIAEELSTLSHSHLYNHKQQSLRFVEHPYNFNIPNKTITMRA